MRHQLARAAWRAALLMSVSAAAHAGLAVGSFTFYNGAEFGAAGGGLALDWAHNGDAIQALNYDFRNGGQYVASVFEPTSPIDAQYVKFRARVPQNVRVSLRVVDQSGQSLQYPIDRGNAVQDDLGWTEHVVNLTQPTYKWDGANNGLINGKIVRFQLIVEKGSVAGLVGTAYFRQVEASWFPFAAANGPIPQDVLDIGPLSVSLGDVAGAQASVSKLDPATGDAVQMLSYTFTQGGQYVASVMTLATPQEGSYVRFRLKGGSPTSKVGLRVVDSGNQTLQYIIDRSNAVPDATGWTTHTVRLADKPSVYWGGANNGLVQGAVKSLSIVANKPTSGQLYDSLYIREVDLLDHTPSTSDLLANDPVTAFDSGTVVHGDAIVPPPGAPDARGDRLQTINYNFASTLGYVDVKFALPMAKVANTLRFQMKVPTGAQLGLRFLDGGNQLHQIRVIRPLAGLSDDGFAQYAVKLERSEMSWGGALNRISQGSIKEIHLMMDPGGDYNAMKGYKSAGTVLARRFQLTSENDQLDLSANAFARPGLRLAGTEPHKSIGVAVGGDMVEDVNLASAIGFKYGRIDLTWGGVEQVANCTTNCYNFSVYDTRVNQLLNQQMTPVLILDYNNVLYVPSGTPYPDKQGVSTPANRAAFVAYARAAAKFFKGRNVIFEIWNEPNTVPKGDKPSFWMPAPSAPDFGDLVTPVRQAILEENALAPVLSGGLAGTDELLFLEALAQRGSLNTVTGVGFHPYQHDTPENQANLSMARRAILAQYNVTAPLWNTEVGASSSQPQPDGSPALDGTLTANRMKQASVIARHVLNSWALNDPLQIVYRLRDYGTRASERPGNPHYTAYDAFAPEHNYGLVTKDFADKPARKAIEQLLASSKGRFYQGTITGTPGTYQAMKFAASGKETVFVAWSSMPAAQGYITVAANCSPSLNLAGTAASNQACVTNVAGDPVSCTPAGVNGRQICPISTADGPLFVRVAAP